MFRLNDKVIYPGQGVAAIEEIIQKAVAGKKINFFKLNFIFKEMTILIPIDGECSAAGIRPLCCEEDIKRSLQELHVKPARMLDSFDFTPSSWNRRNKEYQLKIQRGDLFDIASIYRDLMYIAKQKELSFGEKNLLHTIEELMIQEIQVVRNDERESVIKELRKPFQQYSYSAHVGAEHASAATI